ncbi:helix-turn-helix domain-containing protein [Arthrobacter sp. 2MCAF14]|uniref:helix-turn-helix domain-containing protein n=1 Tax=Arthrobacter sp. 2MCAF14 TaxID=3232982 RepID=UPI003F903A1B
MTGRRKRSISWDEYAREIGVNLQRARLARGLSQERLAHVAGISAYTYQKFEKGESKPGTPMNPRLMTLTALCQAMDLKITDILPANPPDVTAGR